MELKKIGQKDLIFSLITDKIYIIRIDEIFLRVEFSRVQLKVIWLFWLLDSGLVAFFYDYLKDVLISV